MYGSDCHIAKRWTYTGEHNINVLPNLTNPNRRNSDKWLSLINCAANTQLIHSPLKVSKIPQGLHLHVFVSNLGSWPLQTLCCSPPVSLEVWCSPSQCRASSGASAAAAEPAPTQVQDLAGATHTALVHCGAEYTNKGGKMGMGARNNYIQGPVRGSVCPGKVSLSKAMAL